MAIDAAQSQDHRDELQLTLATHHSSASQGYQSLKDDIEQSKSSSDLDVITFDLQQNLPVPTLTHSAMFYLRQLWVYNFGIHICKDDSAVMCVWNETIAGRGSSEIISNLLQYFSQQHSASTHLICYSDSCFGQNKNFAMVCFWNSLIGRKWFKQIDHKFLIRGHTYLPNDRDFSHIEKKKSTARVFIPEEWEKVIASCTQAKPYKIQHMTSELFYDFSDLEKAHTKRKKDTSGQPVLLSKAMWMNFGQGVVNKEDGKQITTVHPNEVWLRYSFDKSETWSKVSLLKGRRKEPPNICIPLRCKYPEGHPIKSKKIKDLQKMIPFIPVEHRHFYEDLSSLPSTENGSDSEYDD